LRVPLIMVPDKYTSLNFIKLIQPNISHTPIIFTKSIKQIALILNTTSKSTVQIVE
jgi:hypothetical protein